MTAGPTSVRTGPLRGHRVLVVEDDESTAALLAAILRQFGHEPVVVPDGASALAICDEVAPSVALVDLVLPGMDGCELGRRLRDRPRLGTLFLVAVTSLSSDADRQRTRDAGFDAHLAKPVDVASLARLLANDFPPRR
jgi:CheY-like chemotaxis protein